jgi:hypothetical protein
MSLLLVCLLLAQSLLGVFGGTCDGLPGVWTGFVGGGTNPQPLYDEYDLQYESSAPPGEFTAVVIRPAGPMGWTLGKGQLSADNKSCTIAFDTGLILQGTINDACTGIVWDNGSSWGRTSGVEVVHLLFMSHIDVGYHIGDSGHPRAAFARIIEVLQAYVDIFFPRAVAIARALRDLGGSERMIYTSHSWLLSLYLHCPPNLTLSGETLRCPTPAAQQELRDAIAAGDVYFHAGAFNIEYEQALTSTVIDFSFQLARDLADELGVPRPTVLSLRDVPGTTRALLPTLVRNNITALSVGVNPWAPNARMEANPGVWADPATNASVLYMQTGPGICYPWPPGPDPLNPGGLSQDSCVVLPGLRHAMCWVFRVDNDGPPESVEEVLSAFSIARWVFPGAQVWASTFENFTAQLGAWQAGGGALNVTRGEAGDNWMQSTSADPAKIAWYREAARAYEACVSGGACETPTRDPRLYQFLRLLIKTPEHTFGTPGMEDSENWDNARFHAAIAAGSGAYLDALSTYTEQRDVVAREGMAALGDHPLAANITARMADLVPVRPATASLVAIPPSQWGNFTITSGGSGGGGSGSNTTTVVLGLDGVSGAVTTLVLGGRPWADATHPLALLQYHTYDDAALATQGNACCFGAPGRQAAAHPNATTSGTTLMGLWVDSASAPTQLTALLTLPDFTHANYGAPGEIWVQYTLGQGQGQGQGQGEASVTMSLQVFNKTATRLAEAAMLTFLPLPASTSTGDPMAWSMRKLESWVDPLDAVSGGSPHSHGVSQGVSYRGGVDPEGEYFAVDTLDAAVMSPITPTSGPTHFVVPNDALVGPVLGFGAVLWQNAFNTNTPLFTWDPAFKWRFVLRSRQGGGAQGK